MTHQILITGNCQRYAIAKQLALWFPTWGISVLDVTQKSLNETLRANLLDNLSKSSLWLAIDQGAFAQELHSSYKLSVPLIRLPSIGFSAFHPDICFVSVDSNGPIAHPPFHSAIATWAFAHELSPEDTCLLYTPDNYAALGYLSSWRQSVAYLKHQFNHSDLAEFFEPFFLAIKRQGCFMHTFNHPKPFVVSLLCQFICSRIGATPQSNAMLDEQSSTLSLVDWPVYPEIGVALGLTPSPLQWRYGQRLVTNLASFVAEQFALYEQWGITPQQLKPVHRDHRLLDHILGSSAELFA